MMINADEQTLRQRILELVATYAESYHNAPSFVPGRSPVPVSGRVYDARDMVALVESALDFWLTAGRFNQAFEARLAEFLGVKHVLTTNSGSSANLLAVSALTSPLLGDRALRPGDEVITLAAGFPTTVNPILQHGMVPVFVDVDIPTYNVNVDALAAAISGDTKAIVLAHTLGNPFNLAVVSALAREHGLWLIEDCCDALGSTYEGRTVGTFGDIATFSFYPAHHITMGEGGAVATNSGQLKRILTSFRDWGRDCHCEPGQDNTCGKRFSKQYGRLPYGYDHKYVYAHCGYNLKITDMQAAVGLAQLGKVDRFIQQRKDNFAFLKSSLECREDRLILPEATDNSAPSWFGFPITLRDDSGVDRRRVLGVLNEHLIGTRLLFGGNLIKQPYFHDRAYRVSGSLDNTDTIMERTFWLGVYPGLSRDMLAFVADTLLSCFAARR